MVAGVGAAVVAAAAGATPEADVTVGERVLRIGAYLVVGYLGILLVTLAILSIFCGMLFVILRASGPDSPFTRRVVARLVARSGPDSTHRADERGDPGAITAGLDVIRARDPLFDEQVVLQAARRALFFLFMANVDGSEKRLRQVSTDRFWRTPAGEEVEERAQGRAAQEAALNSSASRSAQMSWRPIPVDYDTDDGELWAVEPDVDGLDRVIVRLAYRGEAVVVGPGAAWRAKALTGRIDLAAMLRSPEPGGQPVPWTIDSARIGTQGWYDFELIRPVHMRSAPDDGTAERRCPRCGGPYRSDLDLDCSHCGAARSRPQGGWKLDRSWLVADTEARAGQGINRDRRDLARALRGAGKIALKLIP